MTGLSVYVVSATLLLLTLLFTWNMKSRSDMHSLEPPIVPSAVPVIGHLIGLARRKFEYYVDLSQKIQSPIFTVFLPGQKVYVVTDPDLIRQVQKQHKALSFDPVILQFIRAALQPSTETINALNKNLSDGDNAHRHVDIRESMRKSLAPSPDVDSMNRVMIQEVADGLERLTRSPGNATTVKLYDWLQDRISIATTNSVYGPHNPFLDPDVLNAFWTFDQELMKVILLPRSIARAGSGARDKLTSAFEHYYSSGHHKSASLLIRNRWTVCIEAGISLTDTATLEISSALAFLVNTIPMVFWVLFRIYSHPGLLEDLRREVDATVTIQNADEYTDGSQMEGCSIQETYHLDISKVKTSCPLLLSTYRETLRLHAVGMTVREVTENTLLGQNPTYLLQRGALIQMPTRVVHTDPSIWGDDATVFDPRRFLHGREHATADGALPKDVCFRAFGGGKTLCPGRHFASNEVLAVAAAFVARYEMRPRDGGRWVMPTAYGSSIATAVMTPDEDVDVDVFERVGFESRRWTLGVSDSDFAFELMDRGER